jgi:hypothetical protein
LYGLEAINANNGWAMAITGAIIVMTGLTVLSTIISQLHRFVDILERHKDKKAKTDIVKEQASTTDPQPGPTPLSDLSKAMEQFYLLTTETGETFDLTTLHHVFIQNDDPHPHLTIRTLREQGYLVPAGEGLYTWKQQ